MSKPAGPATHDPKSWVFFDGEIKRYEEVQLGLVTHALHYGTGCFEGIRGYWNEAKSQLYLVHAREHYDRMHESARILMLDLPYEIEKLIEITLELLRKNEYRGDCYVRPILFKSGETIGAPFTTVATSFGIYTARFGKFLDPDAGIKCMVSTWRRVPDISIPVRAKVTGAYINAHLAKGEVQRSGADEAIMLDAQGHVSEGPGENLFMKRRGQFVTPPASSDILEGITRRTLIELIQEELRHPVVEREIDRSELYICEELFLCGTGAEVTPVLEVDGRAVGNGKPGDQTRQLQSLYNAAVRGEDEKRSNWLTPVY